MPKLNCKEVRNSLTSARKKVGKPITRKTNFTITPFIDCFGHLYAELSYRIMSYLLEKRKLPKIPKKYAISMVVEKFGQLLDKGSLPELKLHYENEFMRVML